MLLELYFHYIRSISMRGCLHPLVSRLFITSALHDGMFSPLINSEYMIGKLASVKQLVHFQWTLVYRWSEQKMPLFGCLLSCQRQVPLLYPSASSKWVFSGEFCHGRTSFGRPHPLQWGRFPVQQLPSVHRVILYQPLVSVNKHRGLHTWPRFIQSPVSGIFFFPSDKKNY